LAKRKARRRSTSASTSTGESTDIDIQRALDLIERLPPIAATHNYGEPSARKSFEEALKPLLDRLEALCARHLPEALVPSPCGQSRFLTAICRPWVNLIGCHDACACCREEALRALRLVREGIVDGKPSERFLDPAIIAARLGEAGRARERDRRSAERSMERMRAQFEGMRLRAAEKKSSPQPPAPKRVADVAEEHPVIAVPVLLPLERATLDILLGIPPGKGIRGGAIITRLDKLGFLNTTQSDLTTRLIPKLRSEGVVIPDARGGRGYRIDRTKLPDWIHHLPPPTAGG